MRPNLVPLVALVWLVGALDGPALGDDPILASPVLPLFSPEQKAEIDKVAPVEKLRERDDESLTCAERFSNSPPNCLDETKPVQLAYPLERSCPKGFQFYLSNAGECELPCGCEDVEEDDRRSVVRCRHSKTTWACGNAKLEED